MKRIGIVLTVLCASVLWVSPAFAQTIPAQATSTLHVIKVVDNTIPGGTAVPSSFEIHVRDSVGDVSGSPQFGSSLPGTNYTLIPGNYSVSEREIEPYIEHFGGDCDQSGRVTLLSGDDKTCIITNTFPLGNFFVFKNVINTGGGTALPADFTQHVKNSSNVDIVGFPGPGVAVGGTIYLGPGDTYTVSEDAKPNYVQSFSGDCDVNGALILPPGFDGEDDALIEEQDLSEDMVCTVTNTFVPETGTSTTPTPEPTPTPTPEPTPTPTPTGGGGGGSGSGGNLPAPLINITKIPAPLALPNGAGSVTYTYTVTNVGQATMSGVSVADDQCSPVTLLSGDTNNNGLLDLTETWVYQCTKVISQTTTNTATASGQANGQTTTDSASATVVVGGAGGGGGGGGGAPGLPNAGGNGGSGGSGLVPGLPNTGGGGGVAPIISILKTSSRQTSLSFGGGPVTYTYSVTNPGSVPMSNVVVSDDKCSPVSISGQAGDTNGNNLLDPGEKWVYTCSTNLTQTTTNIGTASGQANGFTATDVSPVTVSVGVPGLPNTGYPPRALLGMHTSIASITKRQATAMFHRSLGLGSTGSDVVALQTALAQKGLLTMPQGVPMGYFGPRTSTAVSRYQSSAGLPAVGTFGPRTKIKLISELSD